MDKDKELEEAGDANEIVIDALADLLTRDVMKLLSSGETEQARALMKIGGVSKEEIEEIIKEGETE